MLHDNIVGCYFSLVVFFDKLYSVYVVIYIPKHLKFQQNVIEYKQAMSLVDVYLNMSI